MTNLIDSIDDRKAFTLLRWEGEGHSLPDQVKTASADSFDLDRDDLDSRLCGLPGLKKFPCYDADSTAVSMHYFRMQPDAVKTATGRSLKRRLAGFANLYGIEPNLEPPAAKTQVKSAADVAVHEVNKFDRCKGAATWSERKKMASDLLEKHQDNLTSYKKASLEQSAGLGQPDREVAAVVAYSRAARTRDEELKGNLKKLAFEVAKPDFDRWDEFMETIDRVDHEGGRLSSDRDGMGLPEERVYNRTPEIVKTAASAYVKIASEVFPKADIRNLPYTRLQETFGHVKAASMCDGAMRCDPDKLASELNEMDQDERNETWRSLFAG